MDTLPPPRGVSTAPADPARRVGLKGQGGPLPLGKQIVALGPNYTKDKTQ